MSDNNYDNNIGLFPILNRDGVLTSLQGSGTWQGKKVSVIFVRVANHDADRKVKFKLYVEYIEDDLCICIPLFDPHQNAPDFVKHSGSHGDFFVSVKATDRPNPPMRVDFELKNNASTAQRQPATSGSLTM